MEPSQPRLSTPDHLSHGHPHPEEVVFDFGSYKDVAFFVGLAVWIAASALLIWDILKSRKDRAALNATVGSIVPSSTPNHGGDTSKVTMPVSRSHGSEAVS